MIAIPRLIPGEQAKQRAIERQFTGFQKLAMVLDILYAGRGMLTCDIVAYTGTDWSSAKRMMQMVNVVLPKIHQDATGMWHIDLCDLTNPTLAKAT